MAEFNLDTLKNSWQQENSRQKYSGDTILQMIRKRSKSAIHTVFLISLAELILTFAAALYYVFSDSGEGSLMRILTRLGAKKTHHLEMNMGHLFFAYKLVCVLLALVFAALFYRAYRRIDIGDSLQTLARKIIAFRRTTAVLFGANVVLLALMIFVLAGLSYAELQQQGVQPADKFLPRLILATLMVLLVSALTFYVHFRMTYGRIRQRLLALLRELPEADG